MQMRANLVAWSVKITLTMLASHQYLIASWSLGYSTHDLGIK